MSANQSHVNKVFAAILLTQQEDTHASATDIIRGTTAIVSMIASHKCA